MFVVFNFDQILSIFFLNTTVSFVGLLFFLFFSKKQFVFCFSHFFCFSLSLSPLEKESEREFQTVARFRLGACAQKALFLPFEREKKRMQHVSYVFFASVRLVGFCVFSVKVSHCFTCLFCFLRLHVFVLLNSHGCGSLTRFSISHTSHYSCER